MFSIKDHVFYGTTGVCEIVDIKTESFGDSVAQEYYVLQSLFSNALTYVATDATRRTNSLRPLMSVADVQALIARLPGEERIWPKDERERNEVFAAKLKTGDSHELARLVRTLYLEKAEKRVSGKRLSSADSRIMSAAEKLLHEEIAFVLAIKPEEVVPYIRERLPA